VFGTIEHSQQTGIKLKMKGHKLRSGVKWQRALQQKGIKQMNIKQGLGVSSQHRLYTSYIG